MSFPNLSALAVRERAVTLFFLILSALAGLYAFLGLGRAERQTAGNGVQDAGAHYSFSPNRPPCPALARATFLLLVFLTLVPEGAGSAFSISAIGRLVTFKL